MVVLSNLQAPVFEVTVRSRGDGVVVALAGELDVAGADELVRRTQAELPTRESRITFDLGGLSFLDVAGTRALVAATARARHRGHHVVVEPPPPRVARIVDLVGLADHLPLPTPVYPGVARRRVCASGDALVTRNGGDLLRRPGTHEESTDRKGRDSWH